MSLDQVLERIRLGDQSLAHDDEFLRFTNTRLIVQVTRTDGLHNLPVEVPRLCLDSSRDDPIQFIYLPISRLTPIASTVAVLFDEYLAPLSETGSLPSILIVDSEAHPAYRSTAALLLTYLLYYERFPGLSLDDAILRLRKQYREEDSYVRMDHYAELLRVPFMAAPISDYESQNSFVDYDSSDSH